MNYLHLSPDNSCVTQAKIPTQQKVLVLMYSLEESFKTGQYIFKSFKTNFMF